MAFSRRRHHHYSRRRWLIPAISAASGFLLLFIFFLSILAPSPNGNRLFHLPRRRSSGENDADNDFEDSQSHVPIKARSGGLSDGDIWSSRNSKFFYGCSNASNEFLKAQDITHPNRYLSIVTSGGLNQQRTGITDAVVAARILNATLVVPKLDKSSYWKDSSGFSDIFDVDWFIKYLAKDVSIVKELPLRRGQIWSPYRMRVPRKCTDRCYINRVLPVLNKKHAVQITKFDNRLANKLDTDLQKLRCRVNYHALKFADPILGMGEKLVQRMRMRSGHFIALHLRFEPDMLAFSGCYYGGGDKERRELGKIRKKWKTLHDSDPDKARRHGRCPLTPEEVGLMLRSLGYGEDVHIYVASGEIYGGEETLTPLKALFPNFYTKDTLATKDELEPFSSFSSRMAALDFIVCDESDVFVTNNHGNMAKILAGRRRYFGHKPTIRPNGRKLYRLFLNRNYMTEKEFVYRVCKYQRGFMGEPKEVGPSWGVFHENPSSCICEKVDNATAETSHSTSRLETLPKVTSTDYDIDISENPELDMLLSD
ncbi:O-fucosyltransferase 16-like isoform X1 [Nicotiana tomentosiformis]|uniref:O-fucosyltransferase 16-like isoform X1 n=1 Tax=Nicotiana tomentosiformis TaxID=4098 RepID=UPI00051BCFD5|nr:O-fucosyltransferase 16-like isoform X1 [Nicotiana tomentosiformis]